MRNAVQRGEGAHRPNAVHEPCTVEITGEENTIANFHRASYDIGTDITA